MNISIFLQSLSELKRQNLRNTSHFMMRLEERRDDVMPDIDGMYELLRTGDPVAISNQEKNKFEILFNLNEDYDLALLIALDDTNPEIIVRLITCYKKEKRRRVR
ncbi:MAG: hypothetical protein JXA08_00575 [Methanomicrobiaceae archaeon]|nr:hypothetical protein [Methanomicrobiaceae archaeon]